MKVNNSEIGNAAWDARVKLLPGEAEHLLGCAQKLFQELDLVQEVNLDSIKATFFGHEQPGSLREDIRTDSLPLAKVLANSLYADEFCFHVPKIIEE